MEHSNLLGERTSGFDPNAYKLMVKAGGSCQDLIPVGNYPNEVTKGNEHGLTNTQKMLREKGYAVENPKTGLGFIPPTPIRIPMKKASLQYIAIDSEEVGANVQTTPTRPSVFDRLGETSSRVSVFNKIGLQENTTLGERRPAHTRLGDHIPPQHLYNKKTKHR